VSEPTNLWQWLGDSSTRSVSGAIPENLIVTLQHALGGALIAMVVGIPLAVWLAHFRRAEVVSGWIVNLGRAIPTISLLAVFVVYSLRNGYGFAPWPIVIALALLALPPIYANTYTAIRQVPADAVDSARAMGFSEREIMSSVELPLAMPLIMTGIRVAVTQVVATEALGALFAGGGLGIYVRFGFADNNLYEIQAGAILVAAAAMGADLALALASRLVVPKGIRRSRQRSAARMSARARTLPGPGQI
jgi:osmoprotectant transport system permease protein